MNATINGRPITSAAGPLLFGTLFILIGLASCAYGVSGFFGAAGVRLFPLLLGIPFAGFGVYAFTLGARMSLSKLAFRETALLLGDTSVPVGAHVEAKLRLDPKRTLALKGGRITIKTVEVAYYQAGTDSRTYTDTLFEWSADLTLPSQLSAKVEHPITFDLPRNIPPTWEGRHNRFMTTAEIRVEIDNWPDLLMVRPITVRGEVAR